MKELFRAKEIHQEIIDLDEQIIKLEKSIDNAIANKSEGNLKVKFNSNKKEELEMDEDGSIEQTLYRGLTLRFASVDWGSEEKEDSFNDEFQTKLSETELILILGTLHKHKQEKRKLLIKEFNGLSIKLKL